MWYNIAVSSGDEDAVENRDIVAERMNSSQLETAQRLARECVAKNYKGCKDYCSAIASSAKSGAKSAFQQAQNKKKKKRYWSDGMFVHEQEVSGGFAGGFAEGLAKGLKGNAAYSRVMKGCMAEQGYKLTTKSSTSHKPKSKSIFYCKTPDGGFRINKGAFGGLIVGPSPKLNTTARGRKPPLQVRLQLHLARLSTAKCTMVPFTPIQICVE